MPEKKTRRYFISHLTQRSKTSRQTRWTRPRRGLRGTAGPIRVSRADDGGVDVRLGPDAVGELTLVAPGRITISYGRRFAHIPLRLRSNSREI